MSRIALAADSAAAEPDWYKIPWQDWLGVGGTVLGLIGLVLAFIGLKWTYDQARNAKEAAEKAQTAAEAASAAVDRTQAQLRSNLQFVLIPGLQRVSQELDDAIQRKSHSEARAALDRWRFQAGHVRGLLQREVPEPRLVVRALGESVVLSSVATEELLSDVKPVLECCREARKAIATACDQMTQLAGKNVTHVQEATEATP
jgi:hypothetical protein